jgi:nucleotide-binding universal stress UspA family protein
VSAEPPDLFSAVVVGVDGTEAGFEACRQAARLADPGARVEAVAVVHLSDAVHAELEAADMPDRLQDEATAALEEAVAILGEGAVRRFVNGYVADALLGEVERAHATLLAIGSHGHRRAAEILAGGPAGELLHRATCSVLLARPPGDPERFPRSILAGVDGSREAEVALAAAEHLAGRLGSGLRVLTAVRGKDADVGRVQARVPFAEQVDDRPVDALVSASRDADLLVVGSRGLHGMRALGSVSERVAHQAVCSVLVVRPR